MLIILRLSILQFEILACIADDQDPAIALVQSLQERYPLTDCRLFVGGKAGIVNPLIHNMSPAYEAAKYDIMWVSTSRIKGNVGILYGIRFCKNCIVYIQTNLTSLATQRKYQIISETHQSYLL